MLMSRRTPVTQGNPVATAVPIAPIQGVAIEGQGPIANPAAVGRATDYGAANATTTATPIAATNATATATVAPIYNNNNLP